MEDRFPTTLAAFEQRFSTEDACVAKHGCSAKELERLPGLSHEMAWVWGQKLRDLMKASTDPLTGRVEVDETYVGGEGEGSHCGGSLEGSKVVVVAAVEDKGAAMGRARMEVVPDASAASLTDFVKCNVAAVATVHTDGWNGYAGVKAAIYKHNSEVGGNPKTTTKKFPHTHRHCSLLKRLLLATHQGARLAAPPPVLPR
jgi:hypothetical protein